MLNWLCAARALCLAVLAAVSVPAIVAAQCLGDFDRNDSVSIDELVTAVQNSLHGCSAQPRFVDNGDGTVTDRLTNLMWEQKTDNGSIHDPNPYTWSDSGTFPDGTLFTVFLPGLNDCFTDDGIELSGGFAGHCDWRIPSITELRTIVDCSVGHPCADPIFGITFGGDFWSSTPVGESPDRAWCVDFDGLLDNVEKFIGLPVVAVRTVR